MRAEQQGGGLHFGVFNGRGERVSLGDVVDAAAEAEVPLIWPMPYGALDLCYASWCFLPMPNDVWPMPYGAAWSVTLAPLDHRLW